MPRSFRHGNLRHGEVPGKCPGRQDPLADGTDLPQVRKPADPEAPARFLAEAAKAEESVHDSPGLGTDHRLRLRWGHGSALRVEETIVHLALFGGSGLGKGHHPSEPPLRRHRRWAGE